VPVKVNREQTFHTENIGKCLEVPIQRLQCPRHHAPFADVARETSKVGNTKLFVSRQKGEIL
jgi:hypothetical protein